jgi:hypothetical protein
MPRNAVLVCIYVTNEKRRRFRLSLDQCLLKRAWYHPKRADLGTISLARRFAVICYSVLVAVLGTLLGAAAEEAEDDSGGGPLVVLMCVRAERSPVVVDIEQPNFPTAGRVEIKAAADFKGNGILGRGVAASAGDGGVGTRAAD